VDNIVEQYMILKLRLIFVKDKRKLDIKGRRVHDPETMANSLEETELCSKTLCILMDIWIEQQFLLMVKRHLLCRLQN
jgi:hypothetical protein